MFLSRFYNMNVNLLDSFSANAFLNHHCWTNEAFFVMHVSMLCFHGQYFYSISLMCNYVFIYSKSVCMIKIPLLYFN